MESTPHVQGGGGGGIGGGLGKKRGFHALPMPCGAVGGLGGLGFGIGGGSGKIDQDELAGVHALSVAQKSLDEVGRTVGNIWPR